MANISSNLNASLSDREENDSYSFSVLCSSFELPEFRELEEIDEHFEKLNSVRDEFERFILGKLI